MAAMFFRFFDSKDVDKLENTGLVPFHAVIDESLGYSREESTKNGGEII